MAFDSSYVRLFSFPEVIRDLITGFLVSAARKRLDLDSLSQMELPDEHPWDQRANAVVWEAERAGVGDRSAKLMFQFEAEVDWWMAVTIALRGTNIYQLEADTMLGVEHPMLTPVMPYVLYNGDSRWTAKKDVRDLVGPVPYQLDAYQVVFPHEVLEERFCPLLENESNNLAGMLFRSQRCKSAQGMLVAIEGSESRARQSPELEVAVVEWFKNVVLSWRAPEFDFSRITELGELKEYLRGHCLPTIKANAAQRHDSGTRYAHADGVRRILAQLVRDRYGAKAEEDLIGMIGSISSGETLRKIARWLRRSTTADELLEKVRKIWLPTLDVEAVPGTGVQ